MSDAQLRRTDDVDAATKLYINESVRAVRDEAAANLTETRHFLRNEVAALGTKVDLFSIQSTKEHADVAAKLDRLSADVAELKPLAAEVAALKLADATAEAEASAAEKLRLQSRSQFRWLAGLIVAAVPSVAVLVSLFSH